MAAPSPSTGRWASRSRVRSRTTTDPAATTSCSSAASKDCRGDVKGAAIRGHPCDHPVTVVARWVPRTDRSCSLLAAGGWNSCNGLGAHAGGVRAAAGDRAVARDVPGDSLDVPGGVLDSEGGPLAHEEVAFDRVRSEFNGSVVRAGCLVAATCSCEKAGAGGMVWLVLVERGGVDLGERGEPLGRAVELRDGHRSVQGNNRVGAQGG